jgi:hypothetical protein
MASSPDRSVAAIAAPEWAFCAPQNLKSVFVFRQILAVTPLAGGGRQRVAAVSLVAGLAWVAVSWAVAGVARGASTPHI